MAAQSETLRLIIQARDAASPAVKRSARAFGQLDRSLRRLPSMVLNLKTAFAGLGAAYITTRLTSNLISTASSFEKIQISLDTITKGRGEETFRRLNEWALKMPVNTEQAIDAFRSMRAMGLDPTIDDMTTLVDTMGALGGSEDTLMGVSRALGQIQTKGKVSAEELLQLAERGIPAYEILGDKLDLTQEQLANIGKLGIEGDRAVQALLEGMAERFGGQSEKMQGTFAGLVETLKSYWKEFTRQVMEGGAFEGIKLALQNIVGRIDELRSSGAFEQWAKRAGQVAAEVVAFTVEAIGQIPMALYRVQRSVSLTITFFEAMAARAVDVAAVATLALDSIRNPARAAKAFASGLREAFPVLAEMRDNIDATGLKYANLALEAEQAMNGSRGFANAAKSIANEIRNISTRPMNEFKDEVQAATDKVFAGEKALDSFEKKAKTAYAEARKQVEDYGKKIREIEDEISGFRLDVEDRIRSIRQDAMSDERKWADQRRQVEEKIAAAQEARAEGSAEQAEVLAKQAIQLAEQLAREVTRTTKDGETETVRSLQQTSKVAEDMIRQAASFVIDMKDQQKSAYQAMLDEAQKTANGLQAQLDELAKTREAEILIQVPELEAMEKRFADLTKDATKTITVKTVEAKKAGGVAGFASGGRIPGFGGGDRVRALLERGEFIVRKEAVRRYGAGMFQALNSLRAPMPRFAAGGLVGGAGMSATDLGRVELAIGGRAYPVFGSKGVIEELKGAIQKERLMKEQ